MDSQEKPTPITDAEASDAEQPLSVEEHLRKALAYADGIRTIANLACEDEQLPKFETQYEVLDWVFEVSQILAMHIRVVQGALSFECLSREVSQLQRIRSSGGEQWPL
jgi:hypothetical protein